MVTLEKLGKIERAPVVDRRGARAEALWLVAAGALLALVLPLATRASVEWDEPFIHEFGYRPMSDGVQIAYSLYRPSPEGRFPVLVHYDPYLGGGLRLEIGIGGAAETAEYLRHGYAVLSVSMRGTGCSQGEFSMLSDQHGEDGAELVEWAAAQPWSTGRVGLWGNSYSGMTPYLVGGERPPHLMAIAAGASTADAYRDSVYPGGIFNSAQFAHWTFYTQPFASRLGVEQRLRAGDDECRELASRRGFTRLYDWMKDHPWRDDWWEEQSVLRRAAETVAPTLVLHGWQDQQVGSLAALDLFRALRGPRRLYVANGPHGFFSSSLAQREVVRWFDHWLKGEENGIDAEPAVEVHFEVEAGAPGWALTAADWPPAVEETVYFLTARDRLVRREEDLAGEEGESWYLSNSATEAAYDAETFARVPARWGALSYRSEALGEALVVLGRPIVVLELASNRSDTDLMVALHDVYPDGRVQFVQWGFLRASHRGLDGARSAPFDPVLRNDEEQPLVPGEVHELRLGLLPVGHVFRPGHRIELVLTTPPPMQIAADHWGFNDLRDTAVNTVHHARSRPSRLLLPRLPSAAVPPTAPDCSVLWGQPCRPADARPPQSVVTRSPRQ